MIPPTSSLAPSSPPALSILADDSQEKSKMASEFLGKGWNFPVQAEKEGDKKGRIIRAEYEKSISQAIWLILGTAKGERVMRPDFGCGIHELVFSVSNTTTA